MIDESRSPRIEVVQGDITREQVDAIVNAANRSLLGGAGVDGAIHRAAGPALLEECRELRRTTHPHGLAVGDAVATGAGDLAARWVIHTVGPNRGAGETDPALLASCFDASLARARELGATTIAFPAVSAGLYGWDPADVARIALASARDPSNTGDLEVIRFVLFNEEAYAAFAAALG
ncbi:MAG: O-acetyl-ADP-ribose deacetylase [Acidimicrobiales bacterium]